MNPMGIQTTIDVEPHQPKGDVETAHEKAMYKPHMKNYCASTAGQTS